MGAGRFVCVAIPFLLTIASLVCIFITMFSGTGLKSLNEFTVTPQNLNIAFPALQNLTNGNSIISATTTGSAIGAEISSIANTNITANSIGLQNSYQVYMFNYCYQNATNNNTWCSKAQYNWAVSALNTDYIQGNISAASIKATGQNATLPGAIKDALHTYATVSRWTQIVYIIALLLTVLEIIVGIFGFCSRIGSCLTYFVSGLSTTVVIAASALATTSSVVVVGALNTTVKQFGVTESVNTKFLAVTWLAALFSIAASLFWLFSACCCASSSPHRRQSRDSFEKPRGPNGSYQPINIVNNQGAQPAYGHAAPARTGGYEPYSHQAV
jgi:hypothetical protein